MTEDVRANESAVGVGDVYPPYSRCRYGSCDKTPGHTGDHRCRCGGLVDGPANGCFWHTAPNGGDAQ